MEKTWKKHGQIEGSQSENIAKQLRRSKDSI